ncbi:MAG: hypothetical protein M1827_000738 [Pycnora praestabilis]|nr:MAG: hypothetical protein M1827_000738 [Pycnora praestabilis]
MMRRNDPRIRQTLNQISQNLESANETAQANIFTFSKHYVSPCLSSLGSCVQSCTQPCFPTDDRLRRSRGRPTGRAELSFDFYDDWDDEDGAGDSLLGWGNDELDRLLAGSGAHNAGAEQPGRQRTMSYGARADSGVKRKGGAPLHNVGPDPTIIPKTTMFGFLGRLPFNRGKGLKYKPSAADLQEHPNSGRREQPEEEPLIEESEESDSQRRKRTHRRKRSGTVISASTANSLSSRGDIFPSDEEDDAVALDDEFAMVLERRTTGSAGDEHSSSKTRSTKKRPAGSRASTTTASSRDTPKSGRRGRGSSVSTGPAPNIVESGVEAPSINDLKNEEERLRKEEDAEIERKREAARQLACNRGLSFEEDFRSSSSEPKSDVFHLAQEEPPALTVEPEAIDEPNIPAPLPQSEPDASPEFNPARLPQFDEPPPGKAA